MKHYLPICLILASCSNLVVSQKSEKQQMEFSVQKLKNEIEDLKQEMKTYQIEVGILEGRIMNHEEDLSALQVNDLPGKGGLRSLDSGTLNEKKIVEIERTLEHLVKRFDRVELESREIAKVVASYKQKFHEMEKYLQAQTDSLQEIGRIRQSLKEIRDDSSEYLTYRVRAGDSLEKIARQFGSSLEQLKKINQLHNDLILVGQEIRVPK
ncbi:MAG: LysM peptidoglycan-binding domain-containing protein [Verrucomicrobia bacterium]|nr:LysM peptidoglycan-binding domain-containing protein [Verrucomicrobiota bacterium]